MDVTHQKFISKALEVGKGKVNDRSLRDAARELGLTEQQVRLLLIQDGRGITLGSHVKVLE